MIGDTVHQVGITGDSIPQEVGSLRQGKWSESALRVLKERYLRKDENGKIIETPEQMIYRVARAIAFAEQEHENSPENVNYWTNKFYDLMIDLDFLPNSPTLMNAGTGSGLQYSACYVLPINDSVAEKEGIYDTMKNAAIIHQSGGGTGFSLSRLREKGARVSRSSGVASGPISFLQVYNASTEAIKQGGTRRGANMAVLRVDHPDIMEFINCKLDGGITNFNISVGITSLFMDALHDGCEYALISPATNNVVGHLNAQKVMDAIINAAWKTGDPGLVFLDRINGSTANPVPELETIEATNPCGEQSLAPNDACNLGSINLGNFVKNGKIEWGRLQNTIYDAVRFLDNVITVNPYPLPEIADEVYKNRRIGLGVMGWADMLFRVGLPYDSERAIELAEQIMERITTIGHQASEELAKTRGPFPNYYDSIYVDEDPIRNGTVTTIAPTGTISILANASSGIEPVFALGYQHRVKQVDGERVLTISNPVFQEEVRNRGLDESIIQEVVKAGSLHDLDVDEELKRIFITAHEVSPEWHVKMQGAFQKFTDNGVSKTINLPNSATREDIMNAYLQAYDVGCLGITVFRDGCKGEQVLNIGTEKKVDLPEADEQQEFTKSRPTTVNGETTRVETPLGTAYITMNVDEKGHPLEVFVNAGRAGSDVLAVSEALGRLCSLFLRTSSPMTQEEKIQHIIHQLDGIGGSQSVGFGPNRIMSLPDGIAKALNKFVGSEEVVIEHISAPSGKIEADFCPSCSNATLIREEGCKKCAVCGFSQC